MSSDDVILIRLVLLELKTVEYANETSSLFCLSPGLVVILLGRLGIENKLLVVRSFDSRVHKPLTTLTKNYKNGLESENPKYIDNEENRE